MDYKLPINQLVTAFTARNKPDHQPLTGTPEFIRSFGWKSLDSFMKNDVREFNLSLHDKLESKMKVAVTIHHGPRYLLTVSQRAQPRRAR
jgi:hypothetical protein